MTTTERARSYCQKMEPSVEGQGGSTALFEVAQVLVRGFDLTEDAAWPLLLEWNERHARPPWGERDLRHKLHDAMRNSRKPLGYLLEGDHEPAKKAGGLSAVLQKEKEEKQRKRDAWPTFHPLTEVSENRIATLRGISVEAVRALNSLGYMSGAEVDVHKCFIIHENVFAQARRFDGGMLPTGPNKEAKAKNLPGSEGRFVGWNTLGGPDTAVLLVEGIVGILEAVHAMVATLPHACDWTVLAATSAGSRFDARDLFRLKGRRVRIVPDNGTAGMDAAKNWNSTLNAAGCDADAFILPEEAGDLGDVLADTSLLTRIFTL